ncbi:ABC transporter permease [soil metagenome]
MNKNHFKIGWRKLWSTPIVSVTNILGLSIGMIAFLLIMEYVAFENSYDHFNKNIRSLYRVTTDRYRDHKLVQHTAKTCSGIGKLMQDNLPGVIGQTRVLYSNGFMLSYEDKEFNKLRFMSVDSSFLSMFGYDLLAGNKQTALQNTYSVILTDQLAGKIFGELKDYSTIIGKSINLGTSVEQVTGVCKSPPENSSIQFDVLGSYRTLYDLTPGGVSEIDYGFSNLDFMCFVQLAAESDYKTTQLKLTSLIHDMFKEAGNSGNEDIFNLQPFEQMHFNTQLEEEAFKTSNKTTVWGLFAIGLFLLTIAWINYINTAIAKSLERVKEVSIRRISGATSLELIRIFFLESLLVNLSALIIAIAGLVLIQKSFNELIQQDLGITLFLDPVSIQFTLFFLLVFLAGVSASAVYPAFILTKIKPILALKGKYSELISVGLYRKLLVAIQLTITMALVLVSLMGYRQLRYVSQANLGYDMSQMLIVNIPKCTYSNQNSFMERLREFPKVNGVASSRYVPGGDMDIQTGVRINNSPGDSGLILKSNKVNEKFVETYGMKLNAGRSFNQVDCTTSSDSVCNVLINEKAVSYLHLKSPVESLGKSITIGNKDCTVIGVVNNFHQQSYYYPIQPIVLFPGGEPLWKFSIKLNTQDIAGSLKKIKQEFKSYFPGEFFNYRFADDSFNAAYLNDIRFAKILLLFLIISIFLASLGLFSLSLFYSIRHTKEISIRKILGASKSRIVWHVLKDFVYLTAMAFFVSICLAWLLANHWLSAFAYRAGISAWIFIIPGLSVLLLILLVTGSHTFKTVQENPVEGLKME